MVFHRREPQYGSGRVAREWRRHSPRRLATVLLMLAGFLLAATTFVVLSIVSTNGFALGAFIGLILAACVAACVVTWLVDRQAERELSARLPNGPGSASDQASAGGE